MSSSTRHDVLLANGAAAESWLDAGNRAWFENAPVAMLQVAGAPDAHATAERRALRAGRAWRPEAGRDPRRHRAARRLARPDQFSRARAASA